MLYDLAAISANNEPHIRHYKLLNATGQGSFTKVRLGQHILTGTQWPSKSLIRPLKSLMTTCSIQRLHCGKSIAWRSWITQIYSRGLTPRKHYLSLWSTLGRRNAPLPTGPWPRDWEWGPRHSPAADILCAIPSPEGPEAREHAVWCSDEH